MSDIAHLHLPSFFLALLLCYGAVGVELLMVRRVLSVSTSLRTWALGVWLGIGAHGLLVLRGGLPEALAYGVSNVMGYAAMVLLAAAVQQFVHGAPWGPRLRAAAWAGGALVALAVALPPGARIPLTCLLTATPLAGTVALLASRRPLPEQALRIVMQTMGLTVLALLARAVDAALHPEAYAGQPVVTWQRVAPFMVAILLMVGGSFGFLLALLERSQAGLEELASTDALTGCFNRRGAAGVLHHALARNARERQTLAFLLLDIDHFKRLNDQHGHLVGDRVLKAFSALLRQRLRASDVLARYGGEEFAIVLPDTRAAAALEVAENLRQAVADAPLALGQGAELAVTVSIGVAMSLPDNARGAEALYQAADQALYAAKAQGRNRVVLADD